MTCRDALERRIGLCQRAPDGVGDRELLVIRNQQHRGERAFIVDSDPILFKGALLPAHMRHAAMASRVRSNLRGSTTTLANLVSSLPAPAAESRYKWW